MYRGMYAIGASLLALIASVGIASAQEDAPDQPDRPDQPIPQQQVQEESPDDVPNEPAAADQPNSPQSPAEPGATPLSPPSPIDQTPVVPQITAEQVTDEQVEQLAAALNQIEPLLREASAQLRASSDQAQRQQITQRFENQASQVVEEVGLTVETYVQLVTLAKQDEEFGQEVLDQLQQLRAESSDQPTSPPESSADQPETSSEPPDSEAEPTEPQIQIEDLE